MLFRNATSRDISRLVELRLKALAETTNVRTEACEKIISRYFYRVLSSTTHVCIVATENNQIVGVGIISFSLYPPNTTSCTGNYANIESVYLTPSFRRSGIDKELFNKLMSWAYMRSAEVVTCNIEELDSQLWKEYQFSPKKSEVILKLSCWDALKNTILFLLALSLFQKVHAQKPVIDDSAVGNWVIPKDVSITNNSKYIAYGTSQTYSGQLHIRALDSSWQKTFNHVATGLSFIIGNDSALAFPIGKDSIGFFTFSTRLVSYRSSAFGLSKPKNGDQRWIAWVENKKDTNLFLLYDAIDNREFSYSNAKEFIFSDNGDVLLLHQADQKEHVLKWVDLRTGSPKIQEIWRGLEKPSNFAFDKSATTIAFLLEDSSQKPENLKICVATRYGLTINLTHSSIAAIGDYVISNLASFQFSSNSERLYFNLVFTPSTGNATNNQNVDLWRYNDKRITPQKSKETGNIFPRCHAVLHIKLNKLIVLPLKEGEYIPSLNVNTNIQLAIEAAQKPNEDQYFIGSGRKNLYLIDVLNGTKKQLISNVILSSVTLSPDESYIIFGNRGNGQLYSYNLKTEKILFVSKGVPFSTFLREKMPSKIKLNEIPNYGQVVGWMEEGHSCIISDGFDLWIIDDRAQNLPHDITSGYGRKNKIMFSRIKLPGLGNSSDKLNFGDTLYLEGIDSDYRKGLFFIILANRNPPKKLFLSPCNFQVKKSSNHFLIEFETSQDRNWWITFDFRYFKQITFEKPQKYYNWFTKTMIKWRGVNGQNHRGILYKPENFDSSKKYPIIMRIYSNMTERMFELGRPYWCTSDINSIWFVSRGYLVFEPDISIANKGEIATTALETVESAAQYLSRYTWIDKTKIGLSGTSFGGYEVNYIISHSNLFAAAAPACAVVNLTSNYGELRGWPSGWAGPNQFNYEYGQMRMGSTLWERPSAYIKNSPVFSANKVQTPIFMLHNKEDGNVPWHQGIEWFMALRRLGKRAWLVQYTGEGHSLLSERNQVDYTKKLESFFDFYLKGKPLPFWMKNEPL
jgi:dipeptidyl aminopeptidase/acylaminoacyl peptidase